MVAPLPPHILHPVNGERRPLNEGGDFHWVFRHPNPVRQQSRITFRRRVAGATTFQWWDGTDWVGFPVFITHTDDTLEFGSGNWPVGAYQWSVATEDDTNEQSQYSTEHLVYSSSRPVVTIFSPEPPVVETSLPLISWGYEQAENLAQRAYEAILYDQSVYSLPEFHPETHREQAHWQTGEIQSSTTYRVIPDEPVVDGRVYRLYFRAKSQPELESAWEYSEFEVNLALPVPPTIIPEFEHEANRVRLDLTPSINLLTPDNAAFFSRGDWQGDNNNRVSLSTLWSTRGQFSLEVMQGGVTYEWLMSNFPTYTELSNTFPEYDHMTRHVG